MKPRVLLVEDDTSLREVVTLLLSSAGMDVVASGDGNDAMARFLNETFDLVVLDVMLPGRDGFAVCETIRRSSKVPIVMLTARTEAGAVVRGLECGADDYVTKPFESAVLLARVRAVLRRAAPDPGEQVVEIADIRVDTGAFVASRGAEQLDLSATEFRLLAELMRNVGRAMTREVLLQRVWHYDYLGDSRLVDMAVKRLRDKLDAVGGRQPITTIRGVGYRFDAP